MSVESVSRTLCRVTCLYCFTLFATSMALATAYTAGYRSTAACTDARCLDVAALIYPAPPLRSSPPIGWALLEKLEVAG